jgi:hypothetical protein
MGEIISTGEGRKPNPSSKIVNASEKDSQMSKKAFGSAPTQGSNNIIDSAAHDTTKNGTNAADGKGGL